MPIGAGRLGYWFIDTSPPLPDPDIPVPQFPNLGFEQGINGWVVVADQINWAGGSTLAGYPTPVLPDPYLYGSSGPAYSVSQDPIYAYSLDTVDKPPLGEVQSLHLYQGAGSSFAVINPAGASLWGPAVYSNFYISFNAGDSVAFDWRAISGEDAYTIYSYMIERTTGNVLTILRTASPDAYYSSVWATQTTVVPTAGDYKFVFVTGSWDSTFGRVVQAQMLIDNIRRIPL